jgi:hypothetical protein
LPSDAINRINLLQGGAKIRTENVRLNTHDVDNVPEERVWGEKRGVSEARDESRQSRDQPTERRSLIRYRVSQSHMATYVNAGLPTPPEFILSVGLPWFAPFRL